MLFLLQLVVGLGLCATNVINPETPADDPYVSDQEIAEGIAEFLGGVRVQLVDIFPHRKNQSLDRIGVFRRPEKPGTLINVTSLQWSKCNTRTIIDTNIRFADKKESDFGYTLSEKSRNILHKLREEVLKNATESIHALGKHIRDHSRTMIDEGILLAKRVSNIAEVSSSLLESKSKFELESKSPWRSFFSKIVGTKSSSNLSKAPKSHIIMVLSALFLCFTI